VTVITYFSLILGELVLKQLALRDPEKIACMVAPATGVGSTNSWRIAPTHRVRV